MTVELVQEDFEKDYSYLYHENVKTAHLTTIYVFFIGPSFTQDAITYVRSLKREIKRPGCVPCNVVYVPLTYEQLASQLLEKAPTTAQRTFLINYGLNVLTLEEEKERVRKKEEQEKLELEQEKERLKKLYGPL